MLNLHIGDIAGSPVKQHLQIQIVILILNDLIPDKFLADPKIAGLDSFWAFDHMPGKEACYFTSQFLEKAKFCLSEMAEYQILSLIHI